jgi:hypothetical protein
MFPDSDFEILLKPDKIGSKVPDFYIAVKQIDQKFWVEAKHRSYLVNDKFDIYEEKPDRLKLLRTLQELMRPETIFMVLGLGGSPFAPERIFCLPIEEIKHPSLFRSKLCDGTHEHSPHFPFRYEGGKLF